MICNLNSSTGSSSGSDSKEDFDPIEFDYEIKHLKLIGYKVKFIFLVLTDDSIAILKLDTKVNANMYIISFTVTNTFYYLERVGFGILLPSSD